MPSDAGLDVRDADAGPDALDALDALDATASSIDAAVDAGADGSDDNISGGRL